MSWWQQATEWATSSENFLSKIDDIKKHLTNIGFFGVVTTVLANRNIGTKKLLETPNLSELKLEISTPKSLDEVPANGFDVLICCNEALPEGHEMWVVTYQKNGYYPQEQAQKKHEGTWLGKVKNLHGHKGELRKIEVWVVGATGKQLIEGDKTGIGIVRPADIKASTELLVHLKDCNLHLGQVKEVLDYVTDHPEFFNDNK